MLVPLKAQSLASNNQKMLQLTSSGKSAKFSVPSQKAHFLTEAAKSSRKSGLLLRMEIFAGTYMRLRFSPCQSSRDTSMKLKPSPFSLKEPLSLNLILFLAENSEVFFSKPSFGVSQLRIPVFNSKSFKFTVILEKRVNRGQIEIN
jgi:hypothetical protein